MSTQAAIDPRLKQPNLQPMPNQLTKAVKILRLLVLSTVLTTALSPMQKLEKIVGMSEPSAYRLGAQNYIETKRRVEIPPLPKRTLPGYRPKPWL